MLEQEYFRPEALDEALKLMNKYGREAKVLAGGTDLIINIRENAVSCKYLIDIKRIKEMNIISYSEENGLSIGGAVSVNEIIASEYVKNKYPILVSAGRSLANNHLRNRATFMGNICNASPAGDMLTPALVLNGAVEVRSVQGMRVIPLREFFLGPKKNALRENEIAVRIVILPVKGKGCYMRRARIKGHDLAQIGVSGFLKNTGGLLLALGSVASVPVLVDEFRNVTSADIHDISLRERIAGYVLSGISPIDDQRASKEYRISMAGYLTRQVLDTLAKEV